jgi:hypothetical protein
MYKIAKITKPKYLLIILSAFSFAIWALPNKASAACATQDTSRGTVTSTFSAPSSGTYYVWARMQASSSTNDSFYMEIDGTICGVNVGDTSVPTTGWKWVNYKSGNTATLNTVNLSAGNHAMTMIGKEDAVKVDRILLLTDSGCVPTNLGDNCAVVGDITPPSVSISSPANNSTVSGTVAIQATASDDVGVSKVEFYMGSTLLGTDTTSPYSFNLDTSLYPNGQYKISAVAFDSAGNNTRSAETTININNVIPDTTPPTLSITSPLNNSTVSGSVNVSATASDSSGISKVEISVDGLLKSTLTNSPYTYVFDSTSVADGSHTVTAKAYDPSNNATTKSVSITVNNTVQQTKTCDFNADSKVTITDMAILLANYGKSVSAGTNGDCDKSGNVNITDLAILLSVYGS